MTAETIHTCSYECERPGCIRAQRDELAARLTAETSNARGEVVAWFPTNGRGEIIRTYGDGSPVYACRTKEEAEQAKRCHLGATGPVIPLYAAPPPAAEGVQAEPKPEARGVVDEDALRDARTIYDIACIRESRDNATREDVEFKAICLRNYNRIAALTEARNVR